MALVVNDIIKSTRKLLSEPTSDSWFDSDMTDWLNSLERQLCRELRLNVVVETISITTSVGSYDLSANFIEIDRDGGVRVDEKRIKEKSKEDIDAMNGGTDWTARTGKPEYYYFIAAKPFTINLYPPVPGTTFTMKVSEVQAITATSLYTTSVTSLASAIHIPDAFSELMVLWCCYKARLKQEEFDQAKAYFQLYETEKTRIKDTYENIGQKDFKVEDIYGNYI